jgi:hypothetical protein
MGNFKNEILSLLANSEIYRLNFNNEIQYNNKIRVK